MGVCGCTGEERDADHRAARRGGGEGVGRGPRGPGEHPQHDGKPGSTSCRWLNPGPRLSLSLLARAERCSAGVRVGVAEGVERVGGGGEEAAAGPGGWTHAQPTCRESTKLIPHVFLSWPVLCGFAAGCGAQHGARADGTNRGAHGRQGEEGYGHPSASRADHHHGGASPSSPFIPQPRVRVAEAEGCWSGRSIEAEGLRRWSQRDQA